MKLIRYKAARIMTPSRRPLTDLELSQLRFSQERANGK